MERPDGIASSVSARLELVIVPILYALDLDDETLFDQSTSTISLQVRTVTSGDTEGEWSGQWLRKAKDDADFVSLSDDNSNTHAIETEGDTTTLIIKNVSMRSSEEAGTVYRYAPSHPSFDSNTITVTETMLIREVEPLVAYVREYDGSPYAARTMVNETVVDIRDDQVFYEMSATMGNMIEVDVYPASETASQRTRSIHLTLDGSEIEKENDFTLQSTEHALDILYSGVRSGDSTSKRVTITCPTTDTIGFTEMSVKGILGSTIKLYAPQVGTSTGTRIVHSWDRPSVSRWPRMTGLVVSVESATEITLDANLGSYENYDRWQIIFFDDGHDYSGGVGAPPLASATISSYDASTGAVVLSREVSSLTAGMRWARILNNNANMTIPYVEGTDTVNLIIQKSRTDNVQLYHVKYNLTWIKPEESSAMELLLTLKTMMSKQERVISLQIIKDMASNRVIIAKLRMLLRLHGFDADEINLLS